MLRSSLFNASGPGDLPVLRQLSSFMTLISSHLNELLRWLSIDTFVCIKLMLITELLTKEVIKHVCTFLGIFCVWPISTKEFHWWFCSALGPFKVTIKRLAIPRLFVIIVVIIIIIVVIIVINITINCAEWQLHLPTFYVGNFWKAFFFFKTVSQTTKLRKIDCLAAIVKS